jgi:hypothetical protein
VSTLYKTHPGKIFNILHPTESYYHVQPHNLHSRCVELVSELKLFPGTCTTHSSCSHSLFIPLDDTWYGLKRGFCIGFIFPPPSVDTNTNIKHNWLRAYTVMFNELPYDWNCDDTSNSLTILKNTSHYAAYTRYQLRDWPKYTSGHVDYTASEYKIVDNTIYRSTTTNLQLLEPIATSRHLLHLYKKLPIMCDAPADTEPALCNYPGRVVAYNDTQCLSECGISVPCKLENVYEALPTHFTFNLPGASFVKQAVHWILYTLLDFIQITIEYVVNLILDIVTVINGKYKLVEYAVVATLLVLRLKRLSKIAAIMLLLAALFGVQRPEP